MRYNYLLLSDLLRIKRLERNYSIRGLSRAVGISDTELARIENGERKCINLITLINLCDVLNIDFIKLLKITGYLPSHYNVCNNSHLDGEFTVIRSLNNTISNSDLCKYYCQLYRACLLRNGGKNNDFRI